MTRVNTSGLVVKLLSITPIFSRKEKRTGDRGDKTIIKFLSISKSSFYFLNKNIAFMYVGLVPVAIMCNHN